MELTKSDNGKWKPGQSGNPNGRPVGSRTAFSNAFMRDLAETWADHGRRAMEITAKTQPEVFFGTCARLLPRDVAISIQANAPSLEPADLEILRAIKQAIPDANERTPGEVLQFALEAIRAHGAQQLITSEVITEGPIS
jgi:hypothetical protein